MDAAGWAPWMRRIREDLGFSEEADLASARILHSMLDALDPPPVADYAAAVVRGTRPVVLGAADSAPEGLRLARGGPLVAAGAAASLARQSGRAADLVVTDLDGDVEDQIWAAERGALVFVHAHGDNPQLVERWLPRFPAGAVAGTCQVPAFGRLINPGGFTDGDRSCFLMQALGARGVRLAGFDLEGPVGRASGSRDAAATRKKLAWALRLLRYLRDDLRFEVDPLPEEPASPAIQRA